MRWLRDPDRSDARTSVPDELSLASWSRSEGDDGEVDYHFDERSGARWLEVRGENAKERALDIANMLGGKHEGTAADALAKALTPPRSGPAARPTASGTLRWRTLREVIAKANPVNMGIIVALIRAGLRDPDWRVRMTAMLGVGKLRLAALAEEAMAAKVPATGTSALGGEDRRVLLALRQAAHDRALGLSPSVGPGHGHSPDIADKRRAYQQRLHQLLAGEHPSDASDAAAMVAALLSPEKSAPPLPPRWRSWIDRDDNPK
jgi:hypothetical protein